MHDFRMDRSRRHREKGHGETSPKKRTHVDDMTSIDQVRRFLRVNYSNITDKFKVTSQKIVTGFHTSIDRSVYFAD